MRDDYDDRLATAGWQDAATGPGHMLNRIMLAFRVLHRIHWSAPWTARRTGCPPEIVR